MENNFHRGVLASSWKFSDQQRTIMSNLMKVRFPKDCYFRDMLGWPWPIATHRTATPSLVPLPSQCDAGGNRKSKRKKNLQVRIKTFSMWRKNPSYTKAIMTSHKQIEAQPVFEQRLPLPKAFPLLFYCCARRYTHGISLWSVWISYRGCVPFQVLPPSGLLAGGQREGRESLDYAHVLLSNSPNPRVINTA